MPYKSDAQRRFFHSPGAKKAGITSAQVKEFDSASKGKKLPERKGGSMFSTKKSLFKPRGGSQQDDQEREETTGAHKEEAHGEGVGEKHPHHAGGEGYHKVNHSSGHVHEMSHHGDSVHHSISHPDHGSHHMIHSPGQSSQMAEEDQDSLASEMPAIP